MPMRFPKSVLAGALAIALAQPAAAATGWLPLHLAPELERRVERLLILADVPIMSRPIAVQTVVEALPRACTRDVALCERVRRDLAPWLRQGGVDAAGAAASVSRHQDLPASIAGQVHELSVPDSHGLPLHSPGQAWFASHSLLGEGWLLDVGAIGQQGSLTPTGTMLSVDNERAQLDVGYRDHWWSPMRDSSMLLSTEARTLPSVTLSSLRPLTRMHLSFETFLGELSRSDHIAFGGGEISGRPKLFGLHLAVQPKPGWTLSFSRLMQFGPAPRPGSFGNFVRAFFNSTHYDNSGATVSRDQEFGNQQFAVASELLVPGPKPVALYAELAAEDNFHLEPFRFGNSALSAGIYLPSFTAHSQLRYEYSNWQNAWYVHHIYRDGMSNDGNVLGSWGGDWRVPGDGVGGDSHMIDFSWERSADSSIDLRYRTERNEAYGVYPYRRAHELTLRMSTPWQRHSLGGEITLGQDVFGKGYARLSGIVQFVGHSEGGMAPPVGVADPGLSTGEASSATPDAGPAMPDANPEVERFVDLGVRLSRLDYIYDEGSGPGTHRNSASAHVGVGVRRSIADSRNDYGARLEIDSLQGHSLLALRTVDFRHRMGPHLATGLYFGVSRYAGLTPALGWYMGGGLQWRNVLPRWDLNWDFSYGDRIQRDKLAAGESFGRFEDAYYVLMASTIYISRRL